MTKIISDNNKNAVNEAVRVLRHGGVIVYPTETSYGIGVDATNQKARKKIYKIKKRFVWKKLSIVLGSSLMAQRYIRIDSKAKKLINKFMPGPLTIVCDSKRAGNMGKDVAFRISRHKFALSVVRSFGKPVTATSANITGKGPIYEIRKIIKTFDGKVDLIINGGNLPRRKVSTIYDVRSGKIFRKGPVSKSEIDKALNS